MKQDIKIELSGEDLLNMGYEVFIVKEACGSRHEENKTIFTRT